MGRGKIWTVNGRIEVLEIYKRVGVQEVWFWLDGEISVDALGEMGSGSGDEAGYERVEGSGKCPKIPGDF